MEFLVFDQKMHEILNAFFDDFVEIIKNGNEQISEMATEYSNKYGDGFVLISLNKAAEVVALSGGAIRPPVKIHWIPIEWNKHEEALPYGLMKICNHRTQYVLHVCLTYEILLGKIYDPILYPSREETIVINKIQKTRHKKGFGK